MRNGGWCAIVLLWAVMLVGCSTPPAPGSWRWSQDATLEQLCSHPFNRDPQWLAHRLRIQDLGGHCPAGSAFATTRPGWVDPARVDATPLQTLCGWDFVDDARLINNRVAALGGCPANSRYATTVAAAIEATRVANERARREAEAADEEYRREEVARSQANMAMMMGMLGAMQMQGFPAMPMGGFPSAPMQGFGGLPPSVAVPQPSSTVQAAGQCAPGPTCRMVGERARPSLERWQNATLGGASDAAMGAFCTQMIGAEVARVCAAEQRSLGQPRCADQAQQQSASLLQNAQQSRAASQATSAGGWQQRCGWRG